MSKYSFSGHESFQCKSLWLKKGYDYLLDGNSFTDIDAVAKLGVGKNMVSAIRFWLRAFGLTKADELNPIATYIFDSDNGRDPFAEDLNTLWLLHFLLVSSEVASIYNLLFVEYQREKREFSKQELQSFIKRKCAVPEQKNVYNENTVRKDIGVLLKNYVAPKDLKAIEDFSSLLIALGLIVDTGKQSTNKENIFTFKTNDSSEIASEIILYSLISTKGTDFTVSFDVLQKLSLIFGLPMVSLIDIIRSLEIIFPETLVFTDNSGIKNVQFLREIDESEALNHYYDNL
ncbi:MULTISPECIES: DUF4007 family protein [Bacteroides]|uniref:DUF4007 family protein n=1 Tax=Bacteroides TaxID=816 RepID=UPI0025741BBD|nr:MULTISPECIES: DUF4007 family protein [Bacteroides]